MANETALPTWEKVAGFIFGAVFIVVLLVLAVFIPEPTDTQYATFKIILAVAAAGVGGVLAGFIHVDGTLEQFSVRAGGALALFVIVFFFSPAAPNHITSFDHEPGGLENFNDYQKQYLNKYSIMQAELDKQVIELYIEDIKGMSREEYSDFVLKTVSRSKVLNNHIKEVGAFYRSVLLCEKHGKPGCGRDVIDDVFGPGIYGFWYAYRPYLLHLRELGYDQIGLLIEPRANELKSKLG